MSLLSARRRPVTCRGHALPALGIRAGTVLSLRMLVVRKNVRRLIDVSFTEWISQAAGCKHRVACIRIAGNRYW